MSSPTPETRDPQLVSALEQAVRSHSRKHYQAGLSSGLSLAIKEMIDSFSPADCKKHFALIERLTLLATEAKEKSLDQKPVPR